MLIPSDNGQVSNNEEEILQLESPELVVYNKLSQERAKRNLFLFPEMEETFVSQLASQMQQESYTDQVVEMAFLCK